MRSKTKHLSLGGIVLSALLLGACSSTSLDSKGSAPIESRNLNGSGSANGAGTGSTSQSSVTPVDIGSNTPDAGSLADRTIYFDFDSFAVKDQYQPIIDRFAKSLMANPKRHLQVEGNTDERGGTEYNLALGQKRAEAVVKSLTLLGAQPSQIEAVSFGSERPAVQGHDEAAYAKNRRAELNYR